ncbi:MAG: SpoIID/LytB domain-containing protein [Clostridia bacterium]|nr:SpoIID/LytB domain-containing protein [Clostridia bacterium]
MFNKINKIILIFAAAIFTFILHLPSAMAYGGSDNLRVGIVYSSNAVNEYTLGSSSGFIAGTEENRVFTEGMAIDSSTIKITVDSDGIITYGDETFDTNSGQRLTIMSAGDNLLTLNGKEHRGGLEFLNAGNGKLSVVNLISVNDYVKGVVPGEIPSSWHEEALKAQAVCARNYSVANKDKHESGGFDVCTTIHCQVYGGVAAETERTNKAVDATAGQYLMYNGSLAQTLFFSSAGGHTGNAKYVWGNDIPYLRGVDNDFENPSDNPRYTWSKTLTTEEIEQKLAANGYAIGSVKGITSKTDEVTGQVYELTIHGTADSKTYKNDNTRGCFGSDVLLSQFYTVTPVTTPAATGISAITSTGKSLLADYYVLSGMGEKTTIQFPFVAKSALAQMTLCPQALAYRFDGRGWGHGLGMSQYGAKGMADQGYTYDQILAHYYPGTVLK